MNITGVKTQLHWFVIFWECVFLSPSMSNIVMMQKSGMFLEQKDYLLCKSYLMSDTLDFPMKFCLQLNIQL